MNRFLGCDMMEFLHGSLAAGSGEYFVIHRNGRVFMALPGKRTSALKAIRLYQPQRPAARIFARLLQGLVFLGMHRWFLPAVRISKDNAVVSDSILPAAQSGSLGIMFGNPDHKVPRAIVSYRSAEQWEVAKVAIGEGSRDVVQGEVQVLAGLPPTIRGKPDLLGFHQGEQISWLRLPYEEGKIVPRGDFIDSLSLLNSWISESQPRPADTFPEWKYIQTALEGSPSGQEALRKIAELKLNPVIRHGDFARWNLIRRGDHSLVALDWEWAVTDGMPGIDLVHYFAQDARLVSRMPPDQVIHSVLQSLDHPECGNYLQRCGWGNSHKLALLSSIAYTVGTRQQANEEVLKAALSFSNPYLDS